MNIRKCVLIMYYIFNFCLVVVLSVHAVFGCYRQLKASTGVEFEGKVVRKDNQQSNGQSQEQQLQEEKQQQGPDHQSPAAKYLHLPCYDTEGDIIHDAGSGFNIRTAGDGYAVENTKLCMELGLKKADLFQLYQKVKFDFGKACLELRRLKDEKLKNTQQ